MTSRISEKSKEVAAQLWCLPQHSNKEMDCAFVESIAMALDEAYREGFRTGVSIMKEAL